MHTRWILSSVSPRFAIKKPFVGHLWPQEWPSWFYYQSQPDLRLIGQPCGRDISPGFSNRNSASGSANKIEHGLHIRLARLLRPSALNTFFIFVPHVP